MDNLKMRISIQIAKSIAHKQTGPYTTNNLIINGKFVQMFSELRFRLYSLSDCSHITQQI
jgi:hypothetical protein